MTIIWSFGSFSMFLIMFYVVTIDGNVFIIAMAMGAAEIAASIVVYIALKFLDLQKTLVCFLVLSFVTALIQIFIKESTTALAIIIFFQMLSATSAFDLAYLINVQFFPTIYLSTVYGVCNVVGRLITILAPLISSLSHPWPIIILAVYSLICCIFAPMMQKVNK